jgi:hypothetical protein
VELPLDGQRYERALKQKIAGSKFKKKLAPIGASADDFAKSFGR